MATTMQPLVPERVGLESPMVTARMPLEKRWTLTFVRGGKCYELDVAWLTAAAWRRRKDRAEWATVPMGPFVLALRMVA